MVKKNENAIREAAYYIWENSGCPCGNDDYFWALAIEQFNDEKSSKKTSCKCSSTKCKCTTKKSSVKKPAAKKASVASAKPAVKKVSK